MSSQIAHQDNKVVNKIGLLWAGTLFSISENLKGAFATDMSTPKISNSRNLRRWGFGSFRRYFVFLSFIAGGRCNRFPRMTIFWLSILVWFWVPQCRRSQPKWARRLSGSMSTHTHFVILFRILFNHIEVRTTLSLPCQLEEDAEQGTDNFDVTRCSQTW